MKIMKKLFAILTLFLAMTSFNLFGQGTDYPVTHGESFTMTATPNPGWKFVGWYENDVLISTENPYTFIVTKDWNYVGKFEKIIYNINIEIVPDGSGTVNAQIIAQNTPEEEEMILITAIPSSPFYKFSNFTLPNGTSVKENPIELPNVSSILVAKFQFNWAVGIVAFLMFLGGIFYFGRDKKPKTIDSNN